MAYEQQTWKNEPDHTTPLEASRLNHMEDGIAKATVTYGTTEPTGGSDGNVYFQNNGQKITKIWQNILGTWYFFKPPVICQNVTGIKPLVTVTVKNHVG